MPPKVQQVVFESQPQPSGVRMASSEPTVPLSWWLDGRQVAKGPRHQWQPWPGKHHLALKRGAQTLDEMRFEVRGASLAPAGPQPQTRPSMAIKAGAAPKPPPRQKP